MKACFVSFLVVLLCCMRATAADRFYPRQLWFDTDGRIINAHGGGVLFHDGKYYWYGEHKGEHSNSAFVGVTCYASEDLYNWTYQGVALEVSSDVESPIASGCILERPKVIYNAATKKFVMYFHLELLGQSYAAAHCGVAVSDSPVGPFTLVRHGRVNPGIFPQEFTEAQCTSELGTNPGSFNYGTPEWFAAMEDGFYTRRDMKGGQMARDMTLFVDDDGKAYHIYSSEENLTLHIAELSDDYLSHTGKYWRIAPGGHNEAPAIFKQGGIYYLITSGCTGWAPNAARLFTSESISGPWKQHPNPCRGSEAETTFQGQGTFIFPVEGLPGTFIFMADNWRPDNPIDGRYIWLPIEWDEEGFPCLTFKKEWTLE